MASGGEDKMEPASADEEAKTWWAKQQESASSFKMEDCRECRYIAGFGMFGAAVYVAHTGLKRQRMRGNSWLGAVPALLTSALLASLGTARLLRMNPFTNDGNELGLDFVHNAFRRFQNIGEEGSGKEDRGR